MGRVRLKPDSTAGATRCPRSRDARLCPATVALSNVAAKPILATTQTGKEPFLDRCVCSGMASPEPRDDCHPRSYLTNRDATSGEIRRNNRRASVASAPRERSEPAKRRARERVGESEGQSPSDWTGPPECIHSSPRARALSQSFDRLFRGPNGLATRTRRIE